MPFVKTLTGIFKQTCQESLAAFTDAEGHPRICTAFASGQCDVCQKQLCSAHKCHRVAYLGQKKHVWILCSTCAATYDIRHSS